MITSSQHDHMIPRSYDHAIIRTFDHTFIRSHDHMTTFFGILCDTVRRHLCYSATQSADTFVHLPIFAMPRTSVRIFWDLCCTSLLPKLLTPTTASLSRGCPLPPPPFPPTPHTRPLRPGCLPPPFFSSPPFSPSTPYFPTPSLSRGSIQGP